MVDAPNELKYTKSHEWVRIENDGVVRVGITQHAQNLLGDMVFVELPEIDSNVTAASECAVIESVKAASDVYSPIGGQVTEVNEVLLDSPGTVNSDPYGEGWLFRVRPSDEQELSALLDSQQYSDMIAEES